jgi:hypothetical protein
MRNFRFLRILTVAGGLAACVLFAIAASNALFDYNGDFGWGFFCLAVASTAHWIETNDLIEKL